MVPNVDALVTQLGSEDYFVREQATKELHELGFAVLDRVSREAETNSDPEIRGRCSYLREWYYTESRNPDNPGIYEIPLEYRQVEGEDISKKYYAQARDIWNATPWRKKIDEDYWYHPYAEQMATELYFRDLMSQSDCRERIVQIRSLTNQMLVLREQRYDRIEDVMFYIGRISGGSLFRLEW